MLYQGVSIPARLNLRITRPRIMYRILGTLLFAAALCLAPLGAVQAQMVRMVGGGMFIMDESTPMTTAPQSEGGDEELLRSVGISTDAAGLLAFFRLRSRGEATTERLAALIEQLGD